MSKRKKISPDQAASLAKEIVEGHGHDPEGAHGRLDSLLCEVLSGLGYTELVKVFDDQKKWYG